MNKLFFRSALLPEGWAQNVAIEWDSVGIIRSVQIDAVCEPDVERAKIGLPGMANVHSHAFQRGMAGLGEVSGLSGDSFWTWREQMYRFVDAMTPEQMEAIAALAFCEMLEAGFTSLGEFHYLHHGPDGASYADPGEMSARIAAAAEGTGIGLTLLPVFYAHGGFGPAPLAPRQRRFANDLDSFERLFASAAKSVSHLPHGRIGIAPHSLRAVSDEELTALLQAHPDGPVHIHIAEQMREVEASIAWCGHRPIEKLMQSQPVDERWCLIHATHMDQNEVERVAGSGAVVGLCPITEANLGDGLFEARAFKDAKGRIAIGSDSNVRICPAEELRTLEYGQRLIHQARTLLAAPGQSTGRTLYDEALKGGHHALQRSAGAIETNSLADLIALDRDAPALAAKSGDEILDSWIFCGNGTCVDRVWVAGRQVVQSGKHKARDEIRSRFAHALAEILA